MPSIGSGGGINDVKYQSISMAKPLSSKNPGDIIYIKENGVKKPYIVLTHDYPASGRTYLRRQKAVTSGLIVSDSIRQKKYEGSDLDNYMENTFYNMIDSQFRALISPISILVKTKDVSHLETISRKVFAMSWTELTNENIDSPNLKDGTYIPYFDSNTKRIVQLESSGQNIIYWTRNIFNDRNYGLRAHPIFADGSYGSNHSIVNDAGYVPALTFPSSVGVDDAGNIVV